MSIMKASVRGTITSRAIISSSEKIPCSISISSASKVSSLFVNIYSISSRVIFSSASSKVIGVILLNKLVEAESNHTKGLTIFPRKIIMGAETIARRSFKFIAIRLGYNSPRTIETYVKKISAIILPAVRAVAEFPSHPEITCPSEADKLAPCKRLIKVIPT